MGRVLACLIVTVPCVAVAIVGVMLRVKETKGTVMEDIVESADPEKVSS